jgi:Flp pilus assembly pilin Flp
LELPGGACEHRLVRHIRCDIAWHTPPGSGRRLSTTRAVLRGAGGRPMNALTYFLASFRNRNDEGQDLLEYALLIALIAIIAVTAVTAAGAAVSAKFAEIAAAI